MKRNIDYNRRQQQPTERRGVAAVEVAVILPIYLLLAFGCIEAANATYLKRDATMAAYVAATELEDRRGSLATARANAEAVLNARSITGYTITFTDTAGTTITTVDEGDTFTVNVTAPFAGNSFDYTRVFRNTIVGGTVSMVRSI